MMPPDVQGESLVSPVSGRGFYRPSVCGRWASWERKRGNSPRNKPRLRNPKPARPQAEGGLRRQDEEEASSLLGRVADVLGLGFGRRLSSPGVRAGRWSQGGRPSASPSLAGLSRASPSRDLRGDGNLTRYRGRPHLSSALLNEIQQGGESACAAAATDGGKGGGLSEEDLRRHPQRGAGAGR